MNKKPALPRQTVLIFQGGGALGAYQAGVFDGLNGTDRPADWVIGTSIGAINAAIIAGNRPERRVEYLHEFWARMAQGWFFDPVKALPPETPCAPWMSALNALGTVALGVPNFFLPRWANGFALGFPVPPESASLYDVDPLKKTLEELVDFDYLNNSPVRVSIGAVDVESGAMRYFDSQKERLDVAHVLASCALPPAFSAVEIDGRHYWDGGIHSNTPLEYMLRDEPRRHSLCFVATLWHQEDKLPTTLADVLRRNKELQFASRSETLIAMEQELHRLRHGIWQLASRLPDAVKAESEVAEAVALGCRSVYHLYRLQVPRLDYEDQSKDIDFAPAHIERRWQAGRADIGRALSGRGWEAPVGPEEGVVLHDFDDPRRADSTRPPAVRSAPAAVPGTAAGTAPTASPQKRAAA